MSVRLLGVYKDPRSFFEHYIFVLPYPSRPYSIPPMRVYVGVSADGSRFTVGEAVYYKDGRKNRHLGCRIKMSQVPKKIRKTFEEVLKQMEEE